MGNGKISVQWKLCLNVNINFGWNDFVQCNFKLHFECRDRWKNVKFNLESLAKFMLVIHLFEISESRTSFWNENWIWQLDLQRKFTNSAFKAHTWINSQSVFVYASAKISRVKSQNISRHLRLMGGFLGFGGHVYFSLFCITFLVCFSRLKTQVYS